METNTILGSDWLKSLARFGIKPGLDRMNRVLDACGRPDASLRFFHVAGTNGKGSVCAILASLLSKRLSKVGVFVSPAFDGYRGRFSINGCDISEGDFARLAEFVMTKSTAVLEKETLTEFEALTLMAILYFEEQNVDAVVWETGLGGRLDSTNVVSPVITGITNVSYDHTDILGSTLSEIAYEKAGIIKPGIPIVTAAKGEAYRVIERVASEQKSTLLTLTRQFQVTREHIGERSSRVHYRGIFRDVAGLTLPLFGAHQCENAGVALAMYEIASWLHAYPPLEEDEIRDAIATVRWQGRFEVFVEKNRIIVLDGAHNPDGAKQFGLSLAEFSKANGLHPRDWTMVVGIMKDKAIEAMLSNVLPYAHTVIFTSPNTERAASPKILADIANKVHCSIQMEQVSDVTSALLRGLQMERPIACWGSLYTVEEARKAIKTLHTD